MGDLKFDLDRALVDAPYAHLIDTLRGHSSVTAQEAFDIAVACLDTRTMSEQRLLVEAAKLARPTIVVDGKALGLRDE